MIGLGSDKKGASPDKQKLHLKPDSPSFARAKHSNQKSSHTEANGGPTNSRGDGGWKIKQRLQCFGSRLVDLRRRGIIFILLHLVVVSLRARTYERVC